MLQYAPARSGSAQTQPKASSAMSLSQSLRFRRVNMVIAMLAASLSLGAVALISAQPAAAATCRTLSVQGSSLGFAIQPRMSVPVCYTGTRIWVNGGVTPGASSAGYSIGGFDWYGTFQDSGQQWLGVGENFSATIWGGWHTTYCTPRWYINAQGNVYSYSRGC
jgi:hypothetical protein